MTTSKFRVSFNFDQSSFANINWIPFFAGAMVVVIFKLFTLAGFEPSLLLSPLPKKIDTFDSIKPRLQKKVNEFNLKQSSILIPKVQAAGEYDDASAYAVVDLDSGEVLAEKNLSEQLPIASITKVMTAIVALDLADSEEAFTVTKTAANKIPTKIGVIPGQKMTLKELLNASLMTSANDATEVIRDGIDEKYGEDGLFIKAMNEKAKFLKMKNSHFENPQGFDNSENYSTAEDLSILAHYALNNYPLIADIVKKEYEFLDANNNHKQFDLYNWNGLIGVYPNVYGLKIGNTERAGTTTVVASKRDGRNLLVVLLGAPDVLKRDLWTSQLLDMGFEMMGVQSVNITEEDLRAKYATWQYWN